MHKSVPRAKPTPGPDAKPGEVLQNPVALLLERLPEADALPHEARPELTVQLVDLVASKLGFADPSSFFHAFERWTGKTPAQFRRDQRGEC